MSFESILKESLSSFASPISTARLELVAVTPESVLSEQAGDGRLGEILGCRVTAEWPLEDWEPHVLVWLLNHFAEDPKSVAWCRYILLRQDGDVPVLIGTLGAIPEFGYGIVPEFRRRGYALEAAQAMIAFIQDTGGATQLVAHTYPELAGSIQILERCGFVLEGPGVEERTIRYKRMLSP